jgi:hypothetical protein
MPPLLHEKSERDQVHESFLKRKLALSMTDAEFDQAIMDVCQKMKADHDKSRVTFYNLLVDKFDKLSAFAAQLSRSEQSLDRDSKIWRLLVLG